MSESPSLGIASGLKNFLLATCPPPSVVVDLPNKFFVSASVKDLSLVFTRRD